MVLIQALWQRIWNKNKRIIISAGAIEEKLNASSKIALEIAAQLNKNGYHCLITGMSDEIDVSIIKKVDGVSIYYYKKDSVPRYYEIVKIFKSFGKSINNIHLKKLCFSIAHPIHGFAMAYAAINKDSVMPMGSYEQNYTWVINKLIAKKRFGKVICVQEPFYPMQAIINNPNITCKKYILQLDPWGFHELNQVLKTTNEERKKQELEVFKLADFVFTTPVLRKAYLNDCEYSKLCHKIIQLEFPNIKAPKIAQVNPILFDKNYINILFCGVINDNYRSPQNILSFIQRLIANGKKIKVYFVGICQSKIVQDFANNNPDNFYCLLPIKADAALAAMAEADVLLNIGNIITNQVPSKIFDYFSLGKPVLHVKKIKNCPSQEYIDKYPLQFTFCDYSENDENSFMNFLQESKGKQVSFDQIKNIYYSSTPEYVSEIIIKTLNEN